MSYSVIFFGTPEFAVPSLQALISDSMFDVTLVVTQPDKPVGRKKVLTSPPVKVCAQKQVIPVLQSDDVQQSSDFLVVVAYGEILSEKVLSLAKIAAVNVHPSLLPRWRGASPIQNAISHFCPWI